MGEYRTIIHLIFEALYKGCTGFENDLSHLLGYKQYKHGVFDGETCYCQMSGAWEPARFDELSKVWFCANSWLNEGCLGTEDSADARGWSSLLACP